jgi:hypothetical protein
MKGRHGIKVVFIFATEWLAACGKIDNPIEPAPGPGPVDTAS